MRHNAYADLLTYKLVTCQIIFYPKITHIYELQLQNVIKSTKIEGAVLSAVSCTFFILNVHLHQ